MASTRRDFIRTVLIASGAVIASWEDLKALQASAPTGPASHFHTMNFAKAHAFFRDKAARPAFPDAKKKIDIVVVGGGAAGLAAAWRMHDEGYSVQVIENEPNAGGVMRYPAEEWGGIPFPMGASYFYEFTGSSADFFKAMRLKTQPSGEDALYISKDEVTADWWNPKNLPHVAISPLDKEAFLKFSEKLKGMEIPSYPLRKASMENIRKYDSVRAQSFVQDFGSDILTEVLNLYSYSTFGASLNDVNLYAFLSFYARELGYGPNGNCYTFPGGMGELAARAVSVIGESRIRTNAAAVNLLNYNDGTVDVNYVDTNTGEPFTITTKAVVVSMSKKIAAAIVPDLPAPRIAAMKSVQYAPYITISLCCNGPLFPIRAFSFWLGDRQRLFTDVIDVTAATDVSEGNANRKNGKFVYQMCCPRPESERANLQDEAWVVEFAQRAVNALAVQVPDVHAKVEEMHVFSWGHSMIIPAVSSYQKLPPLITPPFGKIYFTGADSDLAPSINNAVDAAMDTAEQVLEMMKKG